MSPTVTDAVVNGSTDSCGDTPFSPGHRSRQEFCQLDGPRSRSLAAPPAEDEHLRRGSIRAKEGQAAGDSARIDALVRWLSTVSVLSQLSDPELRTVATSLEEKCFEAGHVIIDQGDV